MSIIETLKSESIKYRKARSPFATTVVFILSEVQKIGKNAGNRETTEPEAIQVLKKLLTTAEDNLASAVQIVGGQGEEIIQELVDEIEFIRDLLPNMVSEETVRGFLNRTFKDETPNKGQFMKALKEEFGAYVDMKSAGSIYTEMYGS